MAEQSQNECFHKTIMMQYPAFMQYFDSVTFMDSAGIGLIIGRYKFANMLGIQIEITNLSHSVKKIFEMAGILKLIPESNLKEKAI